MVRAFIECMRYNPRPYQKTAVKKLRNIFKQGKRRILLVSPTGSGKTVIASDTNKGKSGPRPHMALLDEIHEHPNGDIIELLRAGFKFRRQPLSFMITNSGHDMTSVCREYHDLGVDIASGLDPEDPKFNDEFFAFICSL